MHSQEMQHEHYLCCDSLKINPPKCWELESINSWLPFPIPYMAFCLLLIDSIMVTHFPREEKAYIVWMPKNEAYVLIFFYLNWGNWYIYFLLPFPLALLFPHHIAMKASTSSQKVCYRVIIKDCMSGLSNWWGLRFVWSSGFPAAFSL